MSVVLIYLHLYTSFLIRQDEISDCMYVVLTGGFRVMKDFFNVPPRVDNAQPFAFVSAGDVVVYICVCAHAHTHTHTRRETGRDSERE